MARAWFDSHLDLAYLAACGRDMGVGPQEAGGPDLPAAVTLPSLARGNVRAMLGTIFIEPVAPGAGGAAGGGSATTNPNVAYPQGDVEAAHRAAVLQMGVYEAWAKAGLVRVGFGGESRSAGVPQVGVLIEGADGLRTPEDLGWWVERDVVAIGLTWARSSRYAAGNGVDPATDPGMTDLGRALVRAMDRTLVRGRSVVHDASHLSDRSLADLFEVTDRVVIASHSNSRALIERGVARAAAQDAATRPNFMRHLTDAAIMEIARRGGVIGLNLYSPFLIAGGLRDRRATIDECCDHAEHVVQLLGHHRAIGLGSDMDGGFSAERLPSGIDEPKDLELLAAGLSRRGWSDDAVEAFAWGNWARFWGVEKA